MGDDEQGLRRQARRRKDKEFLAYLATLPKLEGSLTFYNSAFDALNTERHYGMTPGLIPRSKIIDYAVEDCGMSRDAAYFFYDVIHGADLVYLDELAKKRAQH